ncbi:unannotated protein [freshwater metagenome]|uniref:Unannotated protein n=1 Tax=freshwater metagenome TaxID=449393 RepID=A0A6J7BTG4_9ZZZZ
MHIPDSSRPEAQPRPRTSDPRVWDDAVLQRALDRASDGTWGPVAVLPSTGSTNADAAEQSREGAPEGFTVVADEQTEGRGRLGRAWQSPSGAGLAMSVVLRPRPPADTWGWLPLIAGLAVVDALDVAGVVSALKWPNDVVVDAAARDGGPGPRKLGGLLLERVGDAVVVGIGLNVDLGASELPVPHATSTSLEGSPAGREDLLVEILESLRRGYTLWQNNSGDAAASGTAAAYSARCLTLGRSVRALLPGDGVVEGVATAIDSDGRLVIACRDGSSRALSAGDIEHLR